MHQNDIWLRARKPCRKLILLCDVCCKISPMAFVLTIVFETATLSGKCAHKIGILDIGFLQLLPEKSSPAPLNSHLATDIRGAIYAALTGLPVIESPKAIIFLTA